MLRIRLVEKLSDPKKFYVNDDSVLSEAIRALGLYHSIDEKFGMILIRKEHLVDFESKVLELIKERGWDMDRSRETRREMGRIIAYVRENRMGCWLCY